MKKPVVSLVLLAVLAAVPLRAQWVVFDPTNYANAIEQLIELQSQYSQLVRTYQQIRAQYNHWVWMAQRLSSATVARYRAPAPTWRSLVATDRYSTLGGWVAAVNSGVGVPDGYRLATQALRDYGAAVSRIPAEEWQRVRARYGTVELLDATTLQGLETIGQIRFRAPEVMNATRALEDDTLNRGDDANTLIAVLNKVNAGGVLSLRASHATNQLLVSLLETQLIEATRRREAEAAAINAHVLFQQEARSFADRFTPGTTDAILGFRLP